MTTIAQAFGLKNPPAYKSKHGEAKGVPLGHWLVGIELEIEGFNPEIEHTFGGFTFTTDGSLRSTNGGMGIEAISKPVAIENLPALLDAFYKHFKIVDTNYSERCSTHVHFNALPLTFDQVATICLLYQTVERLLFRYVGHDRGENIFCVPWYQCNMSYNIVSQIQDASKAHDCFRRWQKYSAMNLIPMMTQGTMEFRHLHGTCDVKQITEWVSLIAKMFEYALATPFEKAQDQIVNMNTVSNYHAWLNEVFGPLAAALHCPNFERDLAIGVIDSKLMITKKEEKKSVSGRLYGTATPTAAEIQAMVANAPATRDPYFEDDIEEEERDTRLIPPLRNPFAVPPAPLRATLQPRPRARPLTADQLEELILIEQHRQQETLAQLNNAIQAGTAPQFQWTAAGAPIRNGDEGSF